VISFEFEYHNEFEFMFKMALGYESGVRGRLLMKRPRAKISCQYPFKISLGKMFLVDAVLRIAGKYWFLRVAALQILYENHLLILSFLINKAEERYRRCVFTAAVLY
jgi:hypothetical protein